VGNTKSSSADKRKEQVSTQALLNSIETPRSESKRSFEPILKELGILEIQRDPVKSAEAILAALGYQPQEEADSKDAVIDAE